MLENSINSLITEAMENQFDRDLNSLLDEAGEKFQQDRYTCH